MENTRPLQDTNNHGTLTTFYNNRNVLYIYVKQEVKYLRFTQFYVQSQIVLNFKLTHPPFFFVSKMNGRGNFFITVTNSSIYCYSAQDPCTTDQFNCLNGGECQVYSGSCTQTFCECPPCFTGERCQICKCFFPS